MNDARNKALHAKQDSPKKATKHLGGPSPATVGARAARDEHVDRLKKKAAGMGSRYFDDTRSHRNR